MATAANILLDFLNRDSRQIFRLYDNWQDEPHVAALTTAINVAVFLCRDNCLLPPGFTAECPLAKAAISRREAFLQHRLIRLPMRETTISSYFDKKRREYGPFAGQYTGLFDSSAEDLLRKHPQAIIPRASSIGDEIARRWEGGPDIDRYWKRLLNGYSPNDIETIRHIPKQLRQEGLATTWPAIAEALPHNLPNDPSVLRYGVQHDYFGSYLDGNVRVLTGLPFATNDFGLARRDFSYDYDSLQRVLCTIACWESVIEMSCESLILLRQQHGWRRFRDFFVELGQQVKSPDAAAAVMAAGEHNQRDRLQKLALGLTSNIAHPSSGIVLTHEQIEVIGERLLVAAEASAEHLLSEVGQESAYRSLPATKARSFGAIRTLPMSTPLAIFCPLELERSVLIKKWKLKGKAGSDYWHGNVHGQELLLYSVNEMGRVPAAVATMRMLQDFRPVAILVAGIAGGFKEEGVQLGHVLLPITVADLATRKIREDQEGAIPEIRPTPHTPHRSIIDYCGSPFFDRDKWEREVIDEGEWPRGQRPVIHVGPVACLDEVVSSDAWRAMLLKAWPKLLGVEMESGGVCAAAFSHNIPVIIIRGISDLADPAKSDTEWRKRAMKTIACLLDTVLREKKLI